MQPDYSLELEPKEKAADTAERQAAVRRESLRAVRSDLARGRLEEALAPLRGASVPTQVLVQFTRCLATLYRCGVPLIRALDILREQPESPKFGKIMDLLSSMVSFGEPLSVAVGKFPRIFSPLYISVLRTGEAHGALGESLNGIAEMLEKEEETRRRLHGVLNYPAFICVFTSLIFLGMCNYVFPTLAATFAGMNVRLPFLTRLLMSIMLALQKPVVLVSLALGVVVATRIASYVLSTPNGRFAWDAYKIHLPLLGKLSRKAAIARMLRSLAVLHEAGVNVTTALPLAGGASGNEALRRIMTDVASQLTEGKTLAETFIQPGWFDTVIHQMVRAGEETGEIGMMFRKLAEYFQMDVDDYLTTISSLLGPLIMLFTGLGVGLVILAVFLPFYSVVASL